MAKSVATEYAFQLMKTKPKAVERPTNKQRLKVAAVKVMSMVSTRPAVTDCNVFLSKY